MMNRKTVTVFAAAYAVATVFLVRQSLGAIAPTDSEIANIMTTVVQIEIDSAKLAKRTTENNEVRNFAANSLRDHKAESQEAWSVAKKLKLSLRSAKDSQVLLQEADANTANLRHLRGPAFDKAYVAHEVNYYQEVLNSLDNTLIPNARHAELQRLLTRTRPTVAARLVRAKNLMSDLNN